MFFFGSAFVFCLKEYTFLSVDFEQSVEFVKRVEFKEGSESTAKEMLQVSREDVEARLFALSAEMETKSRPK